MHLLLGAADWNRCTPEAERTIAYDPRRDELTLYPLPFRFVPTSGQVLDPAGRRGAARDRYGNWYWVDRTNATVQVRSAGSGATTVFWSADLAAGDATVDAAGFGPATPQALPELALAGAAVTEDHYLVVGVTAPGGLLIFDLQAGGPPDRVVWPAEVAFTPFDLAARPGGGVFVLDRAHNRYWELDRSLRVLRRQPVSPTPPSGFEPAQPDPNPGSPCQPPQPAADTDAVPIGPGDSISIEPLADGSVLVLQRARTGGVSPILRFEDGAAAGALSGVTVGGYDLAVIGSRLFVADQSGEQAYEYTLAGLVASLVDSYFPMRLFGGKALVSAGGQVYYDFGDNWLPLVAQPIRRFVGEGVVVSGPMDGAEPGCVWHRLMLDAHLPSETGVRVFSFASDDPAEPPVWQAEPALYARGDGSELPYPTTETGLQTWELAFQHARGRYLRLRLELTGNGRNSPRIRALRAYYPRFSYLERYLPSTYRQDPVSASFLDRFLANFEGIFTTVEGRIAAAQVLFDPRTTPPDALEWLGSWFDLAMDPAWDEKKRRLLIKHAMEFFQWRGTIRGLRMALALAFEEQADESLFADTPGPCALRTRIVELYQTVVPARGSWQPGDGATALLQQYRTALVAAGLPAAQTFPLSAPTDPGAGAVWRTVTSTALGFVPAAGRAAAWADFLATRYPRIADLNTAYQLIGPAVVTAYDQVRPPDTLPQSEPALTDWYQFQGQLLPKADVAHRFRVLLPVPVGTSGGGAVAVDPADRTVREALAARVTELAKPAHTVFDVKFYWEAFRVGQARLGLDTLVDLGGRSPNLLGGAVLGRSYLGESTLASPVVAIRHLERTVL